MMQGIGNSSRDHLLAGPGAERAAGRRDDKPANIFRALAAKALVYGRMFGIDRIYFRRRCFQQLINKRAGHNESLLICQGYILAGTDGGNGRRQTAVTDSSGKRHVNIFTGHGIDKRIIARRSLNSKRGKSLTEPRICSLVGYNGKRRPKLARERNKASTFRPAASTVAR